MISIWSVSLEMKENPTSIRTMTSRIAQVLPGSQGQVYKVRRCQELNRRTGWERRSLNLSVSFGIVSSPTAPCNKLVQWIFSPTLTVFIYLQICTSVSRSRLKNSNLTLSVWKVPEGFWAGTWRCDKSCLLGKRNLLLKDGWEILL